MSLKHLLALAGLVAVAACNQSLTEGQAVCWFSERTETYLCEDPIPQAFPVPAPVAEPDPDEDA